MSFFYIFFISYIHICRDLYLYIKYSVLATVISEGEALLIHRHRVKKGNRIDRAHCYQVPSSSRLSISVITSAQNKKEI